MRWSDLNSCEDIQEALDHAGDRPENGDQNTKRGWSERFADGCAVAIAKQFQKSALRGKNILPKDLRSGTEPLTPLGAGTSKRIDVTVADPVLGLEIGVSLKGLNFRDATSGNFDKNLTGRLYELGDEVRLVHEHLPHSVMVGVIFLPLESTADKTHLAPSSFANAVVKLRQRTGRLDPAMFGHAPRCDMAFVGLYSTGDDGYPRGLLRFFNVENVPPRRGRPLITETLALKEMVDSIVARATFSANLVWGIAEEEIATIEVPAEVEGDARELDLIIQPLSRAVED